MKRGLPPRRNKTSFPITSSGTENLQELDSIIKSLKGAEVFILTNKTKKVSLENSKLVEINSGYEMGLAVRVERNKKLGFAFTTLNDLNELEKAVRWAYERAEKVARVSEEVPWWKGFPRSRCSQPPGLYSSTLENLSLDELYKIAKEFESSIPTTFSVDSWMEVSVQEWCIANTEGTHYCEKITEGSTMISVSKKVEGRLTKSIWDVEINHAKLPNPSKLLEEVLPDAEKLSLRPKRVKGEYTILLDPRAVHELLDFLMDAFSAQEVVTGHSPIKLGEKMFSEKLNVVDNPSLPGGPDSHGCDHEGVTSQPLDLINDGVVKGLLGDLKWGYKVGFTGRGFRNSYTSFPSSSYTNLTVLAGNGAEGDVRVLGLTGLHTASPETGYMSVVLSPAFMNDEHVEATVSGNLYEFLGDKLQGVGRLGRWVGSIFTPPISFAARLD